jgi:hypothetical protein
MLIYGACVVTIFVAFKGMAAGWSVVQWVEGLDDGAGSTRSAFWYESALGLGAMGAIALAALPRFRVSRLLRVAVLLPVIHLAALLIAAAMWRVLDGDLVTKVSRLGYQWRMSEYRPAILLPTYAQLGAGFGAIVIAAIAIKRRHGEWAHAAVMLALSFLLLVGVWLPVMSRFSLHIEGRYWREHVERMLSAESFAQLALIPPAIAALVFTIVAFRAPRLLARYRRELRIGVCIALGVATLFALSLPAEGWDQYLESLYLVMIAAVLAVASLTLLTFVTWIGSLIAYRRFAKLTRVEGTIVDAGPVAMFEITSWLRGPSLVTRSFAVTTPSGALPVSGATILAPIADTTTALDIDGHAPALMGGDRVILAGRTTAADGHPFRASDALEVLSVASPGARRYRFSDVTLVVWRPAVAYLAIIVAVALPALSVFLTS